MQGNEVLHTSLAKSSVICEWEKTWLKIKVINAELIKRKSIGIYITFHSVCAHHASGCVCIIDSICEHSR